MKMTLKYSLIICALFFVNNSFAQSSTTEGSLNSGTLKSQSEYLLKKSNNYQQFKVVSKTNLNKYFKNVADSVMTYNERIIMLNQKIDNQQANIDTLNSKMSALDTNLARVNKEKNSFSLFGILMGKAAYNTLMWSLVIGLFAALSFYVFRFRRNFSVTDKLQKSLNSTKEDFDAFRKKTLDKEQVLMRKLQDELNKKKGGKA